MVTTTITNISETGAYFTTTKNLPVGHRMMLEVPLGDDVKNLEAIVRRTQSTAHENYYGYGIEFKYKNKQDKIELKEYINSLNHRIQ